MIVFHGRPKDWLFVLVLAILLWGVSLSAHAQGACPIEENRPQEILPLTHNIPVEGTVRSTVGDFGTFDTTQYTIEVPSTPELDAGQAKLQLDLLNLSDRGRDIDLLARVGQPVEIFSESGSCLIQADYFARSEGGVETLVIDSGSEPPLRAGTYFIVVLNFEFDRPGPQDYRLTAQLTPPPPPLCPECFLVSGEPRTGQAAAQSLTVPDRQFLLEIPTGAKILALSLANAGTGALNLHVRVSRPVEVKDGSITADFSLFTPSGPFFISGNQLKGGSLVFIAIENPESIEQSFALTALLVPDIRKLKSSDLGQSLSADTGTAKIADERLRAVVERLTQTEQGRLALAQYAVSAPRDLKGLRVELTGEVPGALRVHIRVGKPVEIIGGQVISDLSTSVKELSGSLIVTGGLFQPGIYYVVVESVGKEPQKYTLKISAEGGS